MTPGARVKATRELSQNNVYTFFKDVSSEGIKFTKDELVELRDLINATFVDESHIGEAAQAHARAGRKIDDTKETKSFNERCDSIWGPAKK